MEDNAIINLLFERDESAIVQLDEKYRHYLTALGNRLLKNQEDCEEAINDTYLAVWDTVPPERPRILSAYLSGIMRRISIDILRKKTSGKRVPERLQICFDELGECVCSESGHGLPPAQAEFQELTEYINQFLWGQKEEKRVLFMLRYYYCFSLQEIAEKYGYSEAKVKNILFRQRKALREFLEKEGILG